MTSGQTTSRSRIEQVCSPLGSSTRQCLIYITSLARVTLVFSGYIWFDTKIVLKKGQLAQQCRNEKKTGIVMRIKQMDQE